MTQGGFHTEAQIRRASDHRDLESGQPRTRGYDQQRDLDQSKSSNQ